VNREWLANIEINNYLAAPKIDCRLPIADCRLPIADCRLPIADCRLFRSVTVQEQIERIAT
jgi:hypothetical protein